MKDNAQDYDAYQLHFAEIPEDIGIARWHQESKKDQVDREVRGEIRRMFGENEHMEEK